MGTIGTLFNYSADWQLIINTGISITIFLTVSPSKAQNKESLADQLKLNELLAAYEFAGNRLLDEEKRTGE